MRIFITGANGFLGRHVVDTAIGEGHEVIALVRPTSSAYFHKKVKVVRADLRKGGSVDDYLKGVDVVIHLAASKSGDYHHQFAGTVVGTENLLKSMLNAGVNNLVGISTFSVYDFSSIKEGSVLDESSLTVKDPIKRDDYTKTKLLQEGMFFEFGRMSNKKVVILRPGMIYGPDNLWHALLGSPIGSKFLRIASASILPLTFVKNSAKAIVLAAESSNDPDLNGQIFNIVDDDLPNQLDYMKILKNLGITKKVLSLPWSVLNYSAKSVGYVNSKIFSDGLRFPGLLVSEKLDARFKNFAYTNFKAKSLLSWKPEYSLEEAVRYSIEYERALDE